jgi:RNA polymerase sigma-70 factor, ECF subfamily
MGVTGRRGASLDELEAAYREGFERFATVALAILGSQAAARDAVQDAFVLAVRRRRQFRRDGSLDAWLWRLVVNAARTQRRRAAQRPHVEAAAGLAPFPPLEVTDGVVAALVASLPERQRLAVFLRYYADLTYEQIAEVLGVRPGTVAATLNAAHRSLEVRLEEVTVG